MTDNTKHWRKILGNVSKLESRLLSTGDIQGAETCKDAQRLIIRMYTMMDEARFRVSMAINNHDQADALAKLTRAKGDMDESKLTVE